jgi:hypothetical protein
MKQGDCLRVTPGESLTSWQKTGLDLVARLQGGRDVILAIDLTGSVNFNDEGRTRLRQIIEDSLQSGDSVIIVPFASDIGQVSEAISFRGREDIDKILQAIPWESNPDIRNTDIQHAEGYVYPKLARINQCRLSEGKGIKAQSVVWITDAPLSTDAGITSEKWVETPRNSPFRVANSAESVARSSWLNALPIELRSREIIASNGSKYQLAIADIAPTVQEFCTPAPGAKETCLVNGYLIHQLWLPVSGISIASIVAILVTFFGLRYLLRVRTPWKLQVTSNLHPDEVQKYTLRSGGKIAIGGDNENAIECKGGEIRGYLERRGNRFFLRPSKHEPIFYRGNEVTKEMEITNSSLTLTYAEKNRDFEIKIQITK